MNLDLENLINFSKKTKKSMNDLFSTMKDVDVTLDDGLVVCDDGVLNKIQRLQPGLIKMIYFDVSYFYFHSPDSFTYRIPYLYMERTTLDMNEIVKVDLPSGPLLLLAGKKDEVENPENILNTRRYFIVKNPYEFDLKEIEKKAKDKKYIENYNDAIDGLLGVQMAYSELHPFSTAKQIEKILENKGITKKEFAEALGIKYKTVLSKFNMDTFSAGELLLFAKIYQIDLNELRDQYIVPIKEDVIKHIINLIRMGHTAGFDPYWELELSGSPEILSFEERCLIISQIEGGSLEGLVISRCLIKWRLNYWENYETPKEPKFNFFGVDSGNLIQPKGLKDATCIVDTGYAIDETDKEKPEYDEEEMESAAYKLASSFKF